MANNSADASRPPAHALPFAGRPTNAEGAVDLELSQLRRLEMASVAEAVTLLLLLGVAVPLKHLAGWATAVHVMGPVHGLVFLVYAWLVIETTSGSGWSRAEIVRLFAVAFVPFGGILNLRFLARKAGELRGGHPDR